MQPSGFFFFVLNSSASCGTAHICIHLFPCRHASQHAVMTAHLGRFLHRWVSSSEDQRNAALCVKNKQKKQSARGPRLDDEPAALGGLRPREQRVCSEPLEAQAMVLNPNFGFLAPPEKAPGSRRATLRATCIHLKAKHLGSICKVFTRLMMAEPIRCQSAGLKFPLCRNWIKYHPPACLKSNRNQEELLHEEQISSEEAES